MIKIAKKTSIRSIINFSLNKIKSDWKIELNAFQTEITKALQACEILKTRLPFLHQENKFISNSFILNIKSKDDDKGEEK